MAKGSVSQGLKVQAAGEILIKVGKRRFCRVFFS